MKEVLTISTTFHSPILSAACEVDVTVSMDGSVRVRTFPDRPVGVNDLELFKVDWRATAGKTQVRFENVRISAVRTEPDGTVILSISGHRPIEFTGVMKTNLDTGEIVLEPQHFADITQLCKQLTA